MQNLFFEGGEGAKSQQGASQVWGWSTDFDEVIWPEKRRINPS